MNEENLKSKISDRIAAIKHDRVVLAKYELEWEEKLNQLTKEEHGLIVKISNGHELLKKIEDEVRNFSLDLYNITKDKKIGHGIMIKIFKSLTYDKEDAMQWASTNMPVILTHSIDKKKFDVYAKENKLDFVDVKEEAKPFLPKEFKDA